MAERHLNQCAWFVAIAVGLGASSIACSKEEAPPVSPTSVGQAQVFRFAPPDGAEYVRTDRRTQELAIVGAPLRRIDREELRWRVGIERKGDEYRVNQKLVYISLARDGQTLVEGEVPEGISAELVIDGQGNLTEVKGLEKTAEILRSLIAPGREAEAAQVINSDSLTYLVASRYRLLFGDTIGRQAVPGSSWKIANPPGSFVASRTVTVTGHEKCGAATCARLQVDFQLDPEAVAATAVSVVQSSVSAAGGDPSKVAVKNADYGMKGWMLVEPATMLSHGASLTEGGTVALADPAQQVVTVELKGTTELLYSYAGDRTSEHPPRTSPGSHRSSLAR